MELKSLLDFDKFLLENSIKYTDVLLDERINSKLKEAYEMILFSSDGNVFRKSYDDFLFIAVCFLLKLSRFRNLIQKFALSETRREEKIISSNLDEYIPLLKEQFGIEIKHNDGKYFVPISHFLSRSVKFEDLYWKLINQKIDNGYVILDKNKCVRLIRTDISEKIENKILDLDLISITNSVTNYISKLNIIGRRYISATSKSSSLPPCVEHCIRVLKNGENLPHSGRFLLAAFFSKRGREPEEIAKYFENAPDYKKQTTLYHLNHIYNSEYMPPSCKTLKTKGLCYENKFCNGIKNPLQFKKH